MPISKADTIRLKALLESLKTELVKLVNSVKEQTSPVQLDSSIGRVTRIDAIQQQKMEQAKFANIEIRISAINAAIKRIEDNSYGQCVECGEDISIRRLENSPEIPFCLECQSSRE